MGASRAVLAGLVAILLAGCAAGDELEATAPARGSSTPGPLPTPTPTVEDTGIPADLTLPGQAQGKVEPRTDAGRLYDYICLDLQQQWTLGMGFVEAQTVVFDDGTQGNAITIEKLVAYPSAARATRAVRGLRTQVHLCGNGVDHVGNPTSWRADELTILSAADEAVRLTYRSEGVVSTVVTVVRVGRSVFYVDRRDDHTDGVRADERTVEAFVPTLAKTFG